MRVFAAIPLPAALRKHLSRAAQELGDRCPGLTPVREHAIHVTIRCFGEIDETLVGAVCSCFDASGAGIHPFPIRIGGWGGFPPRGTPRVLYARISEGGDRVCALHRVYTDAVDEVVGVPDRRPFTPHVTLVRNRRGRPGEADGALPRFRQVLDDTDVQVQVRALELYRSDLGPHGPRYTLLHTYPLE